jgi:phosphoadenosine phosphosulfate reductase
MQSSSFDFAAEEPSVLSAQPLAKKVARAVALLQAHVPPEGYYLAFSGGKDSCVIKRLAQMAGVKFESWYSKTTIDPPELVQFIRQSHPDVKWKTPAHSMMWQLIQAPQGPPTRKARWCCEEYKEGAGGSLVVVLGVRAAESARRAASWKEITTDASHKNTRTSNAICPIVHWTDADVWAFIREQQLPYCALYDEGFKRLGCVGCPLADRRGEFARWPRIRDNWHRAIVANWAKWHAVPKLKGKPRFQAKFADGEAFWLWWLNDKTPDPMRDCQTTLLYTNEDISDWAQEDAK